MSWGIAVLTVIGLIALTFMVLTWPGRREERDWERRRVGGR